jgi:hypothetical protein
MRLGIAEIDQHAVAHILCDKAGVAGDRVSDAAVIGADDLAQILGVVPPRQRRRADQIAEHHGQLAPLGLAGDCNSGGFGLSDTLRRVAAKRRDRRQQPAPMADRRDAEFLDVVSRQVAQHLHIDRVLAECILVLLQP